MNQAEIDRLFEEGAEILKEHNLADCQIVVDTRPKSRYGQCRKKYFCTEIGLSQFFLKQGTYEQCKQTLLHEIGHALDPNSGHGRTWKEACAKVGLHNPKRCSNHRIYSPSKYSMKCDNCGRTWPIHRKTDNEHSCSVCGHGRWNSQFLLKVIQNY